MTKLYDTLSAFCASIVAPLANLAARIYMGYSIFFVSGLAKLGDFEETIELFEEDWVIPLIPAEPAAYLATAGELVLPVLLILGIFTRIGALGLLVMTIVIQTFAIQDPQHYIWMLVLGLLLGYGGNKISVDYLLFKRKV
ncbi:MAG: putative oxidoreductase [Arenicella sp.]|jgi:putative oxidoreductase